MKQIILFGLIAMIFLAGCSQKGNTDINKINCSSYTYETCPSSCVVCPPCAVCSSISCQTDEFCKSIGFDRVWYEDIKKRLNSSAG